LDAGIKQTKEVTFVYLGRDLPKYAVSSLELAKKFGGLDIHLIGNASLLPNFSSEAVRFTSIEDFYEPAEFIEVSRKMSSSHSFRNGFWLKTLERLFVLDQYMQTAKTTGFFHAELDQLLFRADLLVSKLDRMTMSGMFFPFHESERAVASVLFCNSGEALRSVLDFAHNTDSFSNEMVLLAHWASENPDLGFALPTLFSKLGEDNAGLPTIAASLKPEALGGVVDAAQLGWWMGGLDPRNVPLWEVPRNKFAERSCKQLLSSTQLEGLRFSLSHADGTLQCSFRGELSTTVFNLHIHSKIHSYLRNSDPNLDRFFQTGNQDDAFQFPGTRRAQLVSHITLAVQHPHKVVPRLRELFSKIGGRRPGSEPFISGDTFRQAADHVWETGNTTLPLSRLRAGDVVFCETQELSSFCSTILDAGSPPVTVLLGNSDENNDGHSLASLDRHNVIEIFAQNLSEKVAGVVPLPIGLENAWRSNHGRTSNFKSLPKKIRQRTHRIMWTFNVLNNLATRGSASVALRRNESADEFGQLSPRAHRLALSQYAFVASPPGNGLDCHRTWEAMYLGCVPIVLRSYMTSFYEEIGLPLWCVDSYATLEGVGEEELKSVFDEILANSNYEALWSEFWVSRFRFPPGNG